MHRAHPFDQAGVFKTLVKEPFLEAKTAGERRSSALASMLKVMSWHGSISILL